MMLNPLGVFLIILLSSRALALSEPELDCNITATFGSTKINVSWVPCEANGSDVQYYDIFLLDIVLFTFDVEATVECRKEQCDYTFELVKPCLKYNISLVMTLNDNTNKTFNSLTGTAREEIPTAVTGFHVDNTTENSMSISWFAPETGKYCVEGYMISWWNSYGSDLPISNANVTFNETSEILKKQTFMIGNLSACTTYQVMVSPFYGNDSRQAYGVVNTGRTDFQTPGRPRELRTTYRGYDFIDLEWTDTEDLSCVRGVSINCISGLDDDSLGFTVQPSVSARKGRVTHLSPCTNYSCTVSYPDQENSWSITSDPVTMSTWVRGVKISQPTNLQHYVVGRDLQLAWAGPEQGGGCVSEYSLSFTNLNNTRQDNVTVQADSPYLHLLRDVQPGAQYNIRVAARSRGWGDDVTGDTAEENVDTGDYDLTQHST